MKCTDWFIDADTHITEPGDVWTSRLPRKFQDAAPRMVRTDDGVGLRAPGWHGWGLGFLLNLFARGCYQGSCREQLDCRLAKLVAATDFVEVVVTIAIHILVNQRLEQPFWLKRCPFVL